MSVVTKKYKQFQEGFRDAQEQFSEYLKDEDSFPDDPDFYKDAWVVVDDLSEQAETVWDEKKLVWQQAETFLEQVRFIGKLARISGHAQADDIAMMAVEIGDFIAAESEKPDNDLLSYLRGLGQ